MGEVRPELQPVFDGLIKLSEIRCPRCGSENIAVFSDGSITCGDCDKPDDDYSDVSAEDVAW